MIYQQTTHVPNIFFDLHLKTFSEIETKVYLIIARQTFGWFDKRTGKRKERDWITVERFARATGFSKRAVSKALSSLFLKKVILITNYQGNTLFEGEKRKGQKLFYSIPKLMHQTTVSSAPHNTRVVHRSAHNKTNYLQTNTTKLSRGKFNHVSNFLPQNIR